MESLPHHFSRTARSITKPRNLLIIALLLSFIVSSTAAKYAKRKPQAKGGGKGPGSGKGRRVDQANGIINDSDPQESSHSEIEEQSILEIQELRMLQNMVNSNKQYSASKAKTDALQMTLPEHLQQHLKPSSNGSKRSKESQGMKTKAQSPGSCYGEYVSLAEMVSTNIQGEVCRTYREWIKDLCNDEVFRDTIEYAPSPTMEYVDGGPTKSTTVSPTNDSESIVIVPPIIINVTMLLADGQTVPTDIVDQITTIIQNEIFGGINTKLTRPLDVAVLQHPNDPTQVLVAVTAPEEPKL